MSYNELMEYKNNELNALLKAVQELNIEEMNKHKENLENVEAQLAKMFRLD